MRIAAVIQARMSSARLPGKMLHLVQGRPLLAYVLDRAQRSREVDAVIVVTSDDPSDTAIVEYCRAHRTECFRGSLDDVAARFRDCSELYGLAAFVRICGDSPLLDSALIDRGIRSFLKADADIVTNVFPRTFPHGQSVEVVRASTFRAAYSRMTTAEHREHVTAFFYEHASDYQIRNFSNPAGDQSHIDLSVNTPDAIALVDRLIEPNEAAPALAQVMERYRAVAV